MASAILATSAGWNDMLNTRIQICAPPEACPMNGASGSSSRTRPVMNRR